MSLFIGHDDLPGPPEARRLIGTDHGGLPISLFLVDDGPGSGPRLHRHPYPELFILHAGQAEFKVDDGVVIHTAPKMDTEWLEPATEPKHAPAPKPTNGTPC